MHSAAAMYALVPSCVAVVTAQQASTVVQERMLLDCQNSIRLMHLESVTRS